MFLCLEPWFPLPLLIHDIMPRKENILLIVRAVSRWKSPMIVFQLPLSFPHACKKKKSLVSCRSPKHPHFLPTFLSVTSKRWLMPSLMAKRRANMYHCLVGGYNHQLGAPSFSWCALLVLVFYLAGVLNCGISITNSSSKEWSRCSSVNSPNSFTQPKQ